MMRFPLAPRSITLYDIDFDEFSEIFADFADLGGNNS